MRVIFSGGGTGGHIYPALAIAHELERIDSSVEFLFIGTKHGLEADIIPKAGYQLKFVEARGLKRQLNWQNACTVFKTIKGMWQARNIIKQFMPDVVIGTGGYVCGPVLLSAALSNIPTVIQEQNAIPGITNKILARFVDKIAVGFAEATINFSAPHKVVVTGNPLRSDIATISRELGCQELNLDPHKLTILVSGGSQGAQTINTAMVGVCLELMKRDNVQVLHVTGQNDYNNVIGLYRQQGIELDNMGNITIRPYLYNMPYALAAADIAVFRAGAIGLAELTVKGVPAILIPYPYAAENHQEHNARVLEKNGAAVVICDGDLNVERLLAALLELIDHNDKRSAMAVASKKLGKADAASRIADLVIKQVHARR